jgi:hypothetical protein
MDDPLFDPMLDGMDGNRVGMGSRGKNGSGFGRSQTFTGGLSGSSGCVPACLVASALCCELVSLSFVSLVSCVLSGYAGGPLARSKTMGTGLYARKPQVPSTSQSPKCVCPARSAPLAVVNVVIA